MGVGVCVYHKPPHSVCHVDHQIPLVGGRFLDLASICPGVHTKE